MVIAGPRRRITQEVGFTVLSTPREYSRFPVESKDTRGSAEVVIDPGKVEQRTTSGERMSGKRWVQEWMLAGVVAGLVGACALRQTTNEEFERALEEHNASVERKDRIVCRKERVIGSHFKERVCRYQWQLDDGNLAGRAALDEVRNNIRMTDVTRQGQ
ncbi:MAG: hypothetical protein OXU20_05655 [Myxococcales bacterium]|nr:hypothetical protein [Myxococcales bacterium]MDD9964808.1 hypothetical protein [Myxococcales bacterium]